MSQAKICGFAASAVICALLLTVGCAELAEETTKPKVEPEEQKPTVKLALKFTPEDLTTYKITTERERGVIWEGPLINKPKNFVGGHTGNRIEMTFTQQIQSVDDEGNAVAKITIKRLKYLAKVKDNIILDFDSSREKDLNNPLSKLIGQSYTIEITASGQVSKVIDVSGARTAVGGVSSNQRAARLLSTEVIKEQHSIPALSAVEKNQLRPGDSWSDIKTFSFGPMGSKSYERIYELKEINNINGRRIAIIKMSVVPSSEKAKELHKEQVTGFFSKLFDTTETYTGELRLDLTAGKVEKYFEEFRSDWIAVDPMAPEKEKEPDMLRMSATRFYRIERID
ncbi:MAG: hypothetical protein IIB56_08905 [Planctomycetes bacterium]|nr:hypothetical protein [Planctomycetota bacterium]